MGLNSSISKLISWKGWIYLEHQVSRKIKHSYSLLDINIHPNFFFLQKYCIDIDNTSSNPVCGHIYILKCIRPNILTCMKPSALSYAIKYIHNNWENVHHKKNRKCQGFYFLFLWTYKNLITSLFNVWFCSCYLLDWHWSVFCEEQREFSYTSAKKWTKR